jgi:Zn-finger nucleic acid-binding protein
MDCPICKVELKMAERQGVEIDYCPQCRGVWLDRGELDKIIEKSTLSVPPSGVPGSREGERRYEDRRQDEGSHPGEHGGHGYDERYGGKKHKKKSFLGDIFDF